MVTVADFTIPTAAVPTGALFDRLPGLTIELERIVPVYGAIVPYAWAYGVDLDAVEGIIAAFPDETPHPDLTDIALVDVVDDAMLLRLEWAANVGGLLGSLAESAVVLVSGVGTANRWRIEVRGEDRVAVSAFQSTCEENGVPAELTALHALAPLGQTSGAALTDAQREALVLAFERGYYETPRGTTLEAVAEELGITGQSLGARLNRGIGRLVETAVVGSSETAE